MNALEAYLENHFLPGRPAAPSFPMEDEPHVAVWEEYAATAAHDGVLPSLARRLPQLAFRVREGISETEAYRAATRRGEPPAGDDATGLVLEHPERLRLLIHPTPAGRIPVLAPHGRADFAALHRAFLNRNEPVEIPASQGATIVAGFNNWDRVARVRDEEGWQSQKHLYQDRFLLLSNGPYSGVEGIDLDASFLIRLEHEVAHYVTRRAFGSMKGRMHDELLADYFGISAATGGFCADYFLPFVGLEDFETSRRIRPGGRILNYRGDPALSDADLAVVADLVCQAARNLERWDLARQPPTVTDLVGRGGDLWILAGLSLPELAAPDAVERLQRAA